MTFIVPSGSGRVRRGRWYIPGLHEDLLPLSPARHGAALHMDSGRERSLRGPRRHSHWHMMVTGARRGVRQAEGGWERGAGGWGCSKQNSRKACGRRETWLVVSGGALEGPGVLWLHARVACLGSSGREMGKRGGEQGFQRWGNREQATLRSSCVVYTGPKILFMELCGHVAGSHSIVSHNLPSCL